MTNKPPAPSRPAVGTVVRGYAQDGAMIPTMAKPVGKPIGSVNGGLQVPTMVKTPPAPAAPAPTPPTNKK